MAQIAIIAVMAVAAMYKARQAKNLKTEEEIGLRAAGGRAKAAGQREANEERRLKERMHSRALLIAAASGGGVDDPGMVNLIGDLNAEGEYRIMSRLWAGEDAAEGFAFRADQAKREGDAAIQAGYADAISSAASMYGKFGAGGSTTTPVSSTPTFQGQYGAPAGQQTGGWGNPFEGMYPRMGG